MYWYHPPRIRHELKKSECIPECKSECKSECMPENEIPEDNNGTCRGSKICYIAGFTVLAGIIIKVIFHLENVLKHIKHDIKEIKHELSECCNQDEEECCDDWEEECSIDSQVEEICDNKEEEAIEEKCLGIKQLSTGLVSNLNGLLYIRITNETDRDEMVPITMYNCVSTVKRIAFERVAMVPAWDQCIETFSVGPGPMQVEEFEIVLEVESGLFAIAYTSDGTPLELRECP